MKIIKIGIYKIINPNGKVYIGQSMDIDRRWFIHKGLYEENVDTPLKRSFLKYGVENHKFEIIEECLIENLDEREVYWKTYYLDLIGWKQVLFCELYDKGGGPKSQETKDKIGKAKKGHICYQNPERGNKISDKLKGIKKPNFPKTTKNKGVPKPKDFGGKISLTRIGKTHTQESKNKIGEKNRNNKYNLNGGKPVLQLDKEDNFIKEWVNGRRACQELNISMGDINAVCRGRQKTAKGFKWCYKELNKNK